MSILSLPPLEAFAISKPPRVIAWMALTPSDAARAALEFPPPDSSDWHTFRNGPLEDGKQEGSAAIAGPVVAEILEEFDSRLTPYLSEIFELPLQPDPHRTGAGLHQSGPGARLGMHIDFNVHPQDPELIRAVNAILFLTDTLGAGALLLDGVQPQTTRFRPTPGMLVAFACSDEIWHGHPEPMREGSPLRKTIPGYWFRPRREGEQIAAHSTIFRDAR